MIIIPILLYLIILIILFIIKPSIMFNQRDGIIKTYNSKSLLTLDLMYPIIAILAYYIYLIINLVI